jgi:hypothetical protein
MLAGLAGRASALDIRAGRAAAQACCPRSPAMGLLLATLACHPRTLTLACTGRAHPRSRAGRACSLAAVARAAVLCCARSSRRPRVGRARVQSMLTHARGPDGEREGKKKFMRCLGGSMSSAQAPSW